MLCAVCCVLLRSMAPVYAAASGCLRQEVDFRLEMEGDGILKDGGAEQTLCLNIVLE